MSSSSSSRTRRWTSRRRRSNRDQIPAGWLEYRPLYRSVGDTRLLPFKCPLRRTILRNVDIDERFSLDDLINQLRCQGQRLGLIIDLTDTDRYYDYRDVTDRRIAYRKIRVPGHQEIPEDCSQLFFRTIRKFLRQNRDNNKLIGIHCTHGVNRTGYLITRYLIEQRGFEPDQAIRAFQEARGYPIEKYLDDLKRRIPTVVSLLDEPFSSSSEDTDEEEKQDENDRPLPSTRPSSA